MDRATLLSLVAQVAVARLDSVWRTDLRDLADGVAQAGVASLLERYAAHVAAGEPGAPAADLRMDVLELSQVLVQRGARRPVLVYLAAFADACHGGERLRGALEGLCRTADMVRDDSSESDAQIKAVLDVVFAEDAEVSDGEGEDVAEDGVGEGESDGGDAGVSVPEVRLHGVELGDAPGMREAHAGDPDPSSPEDGEGDPGLREMAVVGPRSGGVDVSPSGESIEPGIAEF